MKKISLLLMSITFILGTQSCSVEESNAELYEEKLLEEDLKNTLESKITENAAAISIIEGAGTGEEIVIFTFPDIEETIYFEKIYVVYPENTILDRKIYDAMQYGTLVYGKDFYAVHDAECDNVSEWYIPRSGEKPKGDTLKDKAIPPPTSPPILTQSNEDLFTGPVDHQNYILVASCSEAVDFYAKSLDYTR